MADGVDALQRAPHRVGVADVADQQLGVALEVGGAGLIGVDLAVQSVEHTDGGPGLQELAGEMGADEPGTAGDEDMLHCDPVAGVGRDGCPSGVRLG